ncbi:MAG: hypothetical protein LCH85_00525 [Chloroflexi bacterium]|nr:hypothetical protein [Chloroflexota bacterium]
MLAWLKRIGFGWLLLVGLSGCGNTLPSESITNRSGGQPVELATEQPQSTVIPTLTEVETPVTMVDPTITEVIEEPTITPDIQPVHGYNGSREACEANYERIPLEPATEQAVQAAFAQTQLRGSAEVYGRADWQTCSDAIAWIMYSLEVEVAPETDQATLLEYAQILQTLMQDLQNQPGLQYPILGASIYWRFGEDSCSWDYDYATTINPDGNAWYLKYTSSTKQTDVGDPVCKVAETPAPSNYCFPSRYPEPLSEAELAPLQTALDQTQIVGYATGYWLRTGTSCNYQSARLGYHFFIDRPADETMQTYEAIAQQLQAIIVDSRQDPSLDYPAHMLVITWRGIKGGCSWGYDYAEDAQGHVWYPRLSPYFGSDYARSVCKHQEVVESTIPRPTNSPLFTCGGSINFGTSAVPRYAEDQVRQALQQAGIEASVKIRGNSEGNGCHYGNINISYSITLDRPTNADQAQLEQQVATIQSILDQQQFEISVSGLSITWQMGELECAWLYTYTWQDGDFGWEFKQVWPYPCPQE